MTTDSSFAQIKDSLQLKDSAVTKDSLLSLQKGDSILQKPVSDSEWKISPAIPLQQRSQQVLQQHPYSGFKTGSINYIKENIKKSDGKELLFYVLVGLLLIFAFLRRSFPKYFNDLFRLFFRTTIKQRQIREQLMQTPLPSLLMNGFFVVNGGLYLSFLLRHFELKTVDNFWLLFLYCVLGISMIYFIKFISLKFSGWVFNMQEAANSYIFLVFVVNKIIGITLLPFLIFLAFMQGSAYSMALMLSWCSIGILLLYRVILTYTAVRNQIKVNPFHFFLYFCALEIAPLLLIYKALLIFFK